MMAGVQWVRILSRKAFLPSPWTGRECGALLYGWKVATPSMEVPPRITERGVGGNAAWHRQAGRQAGGRKA